MNLKKLAKALMAFALLLALFACSEAKSKTRIIGEWELSKYNGDPVSKPWLKMSIKEDNTLVFDVDGQEFDGTWMENKDVNEVLEKAESDEKGTGYDLYISKSFVGIALYAPKDDSVLFIAADQEFSALFVRSK